MEGLDGPVEVRRDAAGVPHLYATTTHDLFFAQGVTHAQDRAWQMDVQRRTGHGRQAELLGSGALPADHFFRALGTEEAAARDLAVLEPQTRAALDAYAAGVNGYAAAHAPLALEFQLLGVGWEPWQPTDSLVWLKVVQWQWSGGWGEPLLRARLAARVGTEQAAFLLNEQPLAAATVAALAPFLDSTSQQDAFVSPLADPRASPESWAIAGSRATSGLPLLASNVPLEGEMPDPWYEMSLHAPGLEVTGVSLPGVPGVLVGHTEGVAWGLGAPIEGGVVLTAGVEQSELTGHQETIPLHGGETMPFTVLNSPNGVPLAPVLADFPPEMALAWRGTAQPSHWLDAVLALNRAGSRAEAEAALEAWDAPAMRLMLADAEGASASVVGEVAVGASALPRLDAASAPTWARAEAPAAPETLVADPLSFLLDAGGDPARTRALGTRLLPQETITPDRLASVLGSFETLEPDALVTALTALPSDDIIVQRTQEQLSTWNGVMDPDLPGAAIYEVTRELALRGALRDDLNDAALLESYLADDRATTQLLVQLLDAPMHPLWDDATTPAQEGRDAILGTALHETTEQLGRHFGDVPHEWFWGRLHRAAFTHPLDGLHPLAGRWSHWAGVGGSARSLWAIPHAPGTFQARGVASYRQVLAVGTWDDSLAIHPTGQSGHPLHAHFADMLPVWQRGQLWPLPWSREAVETGSESNVLELVP